MVDITYHPRGAPPDARFAIVIPTWNNLPYLKLCLESLRKHSHFRHQVILHINEGTDGTLAWAREQELSFTHSPSNVGICYGMNAAASLARAPALAYFNDDMYVCPDWDRALVEDIEQQDTPLWFVSSTLIEPSGTGNPCVIHADFGQTVESFRESELLARFSHLPKEDQQNPGGAANVVPLSLWRQVGGYSIEFSPGWNSDPDFAMKLWHAGVRYFKTVSDSRVYHFHNKTGRRVGPRDQGRRLFAAKWGLTSAKFMKHYLHHGEPFEGRLTDPAPHWELLFARLRGRFAGLFRPPPAFK